MFIAEFEAWQILTLLFSGAVFGFIAAWLLWIFWWAERKKRLEEKGEHYRERIQGRFDRLHEQAEHKD
jgi:hypothetical protein